MGRTKKGVLAPPFFGRFIMRKLFFGYAAIFSSSVKERRGKVIFLSYTKMGNLIFKKKT